METVDEMVEKVVKQEKTINIDDLHKELNEKLKPLGKFVIGTTIRNGDLVEWETKPIYEPPIYLEDLNFNSENNPGKKFSWSFVQTVLLPIFSMVGVCLILLSIILYFII